MVSAFTLEVNYRKLSPHQLVVLGQALRPAGCAGLNLYEREEVKSTSEHFILVGCG